MSGQIQVCQTHNNLISKNYISIDDDFRRLFADVRKHRAEIDIKITPTARDNSPKDKPRLLR